MSSNMSSMGSMGNMSSMGSMGSMGKMKNKVPNGLLGKGKNNNENDNEKNNNIQKDKKPVTEFSYFSSKSLILIIVTNIIFYINRYIAENARNMNSYNYNIYMLYAYLIYIAVLVFEIYTYESEHPSRLVNLLMVSVLLLYASNWAIVKYLKKGFWVNLFASFGICFFIYGIYIAGSYVSIKSLGSQISDPIFFTFNYAFEINQSLFKFMYTIFPIVFISFASWNYNTKASQLINQNIMGFFTSFIYVFIMLISAIKVQLLNKKQFLNLSISYHLVLYVFSIIGTYVVLNSIKDACNGLADTVNSKKEADLIQLIINLILISIIIMLILNDVRKWSFFNYLSYLLITAFVIIVFFGLTTKYPSISLFSLWSVVEWFILTTYNTHDTGNSFSFVMMNHKYNLASTNKEGSV